MADHAPESHCRVVFHALAGPDDEIRVVFDGPACHRLLVGADGKGLEEIDRVGRDDLEPRPDESLEQPCEKVREHGLKEPRLGHGCGIARIEKRIRAAERLELLDLARKKCFKVGPFFSLRR